MAINTSKTAQAAENQDLITANQAAKNLLGEYPIDVLGYLNFAEKALNWHNELYKIIREEIAAGKAGDKYTRAGALAEIGAHLSQENQGFFDSVASSVRASLVEAGLEVGGAA
ncbi:MAG: hypothetical protein RIR18_1280 [Pseudomonadota bacterium]|jgi:hypothetical protein